MMPLFWIALAFTTGILCARWTELPVWPWVVLSLLLLAITIIGRKYYGRCPLFNNERGIFHVWPSLLILFFALGGLRCALQQPHWTNANLAWYNDSGTYTLTVVVDGSPDRREGATYLHVAARELYDPATLTYQRIHGSALLRVSADNAWQLGDVLRFTAAPRTPFVSEDFSYRNYLERLGVYTVIYYPVAVEKVDSGQASAFALVMEKLRQKASQTIFAIFPQPESGLMAGILLGNDNDLPEVVAQAYRDTGTAHIIAISGFNMAVLAAFFTTIFSKFFNRWRSLLLASLMLVLYAVFVGSSPSVVRAVIMSILAFGGQLIGRRNTGLNALGLAAGGMLLVNPLLPWDASFQLSFAATLGLLCFAAPLQNGLSGWLERHFSEATSAKLTGPVSEYFLFSLAAQAMTLPIIALQFHRLSLTSLIANPLVLPVQPAVLVSGAIATLVGMVWLPGGRVLAALTWPLLAYSNSVVQLLAKLRGSAVTLSPSTSFWLSCIVLVLVLLILLRNIFMKLFKNIKWFYWVAFLAVVLGLLSTMLARRPDGNLHLVLLRAGDGTALFLRGANGASLLIDPSGSPNQLASAVSQRFSPWNFHVGAALLTNRDAAKELDALNQRLPIETAILTSPIWQVGADESTVTLPAGMVVKQLGENEIVQIEEGLILQPIASDGTHTALLITYGNTRILVPGGVRPEVLLEQQVAPLGGLSTLILGEADIQNLPVDMWQNFGAQVILWNSIGISPNPGWHGLDKVQSIELVTDGKGYSIK
jgi:competence protein ComEC